MNKHYHHKSERASSNRSTEQTTIVSVEQSIGVTESMHEEVNESSGAFATLLPELRRAVAENGYRTPTPIQSQAIPHLIEGRDLLGCAQTGTGKTAAFMLPILQHLAMNKRTSVPRRPRVLVLAPTRELAMQVGESAGQYGKHLRTRSAVIFGGVSQNPQVAALRRGADIVVATPGRLLDLIDQRHLHLGGIEIFVLDEADRMLDMGFIHDIRKVIAMLPAKRQSLFFSATMSPEVVTLANTLVHDAVRVTIDAEKPAVERIKQKVLFVDKQSKNTLLKSLLDDSELHKVIVFTRMKHAANKVANKLMSFGVSAVAIHGNKSQNARTQALARFKSGDARILVATDIAARGLDVDSISHVINYDLPNEPETYIHRIGRTARAGSEGTAISFCTAEERGYLHHIERLLGASVPMDNTHDFHCETARNARPGRAEVAKKSRRGQSAQGRNYHASRRGRIAHSR